MASHIREPIISVLGHVDHGKTTVLDYIRSSVIASREAGGITQHIGATDVPIEVIEKVCEGAIDKDKISIPIRGLLFIDTPGHAAFTNLRRRGGSVADLAILVVDINEGLMPQTIESLEILKQYKTPFVVAANKVDRIHGWLKNVHPKKQNPHALQEYNNKFYKLVGDLSIKGYDCDSFENIQDFSKSVAIVPVSAVTGQGIKELMMMLIGMAQTYLKDTLDVSIDDPGKGTILEVKETKGLGTTLDAIIYEGVIRVNDTIVVAAREPIVTKVKALLRPNALDDMRDPRQQFKSVKKVIAASGVKIVAHNLETAMSGGPIYVGGTELVESMKSEIGEVEFVREESGVIVKADTLGSLEALVKILEGEGISVKKGSIGKVSKHDIIEATAVANDSKYEGIVMAFNAPILSDAQTLANDYQISIFSSKIIYQIVEDYEEWIKKEKEFDRKQLIKCIATPARIRLLPNHTFRQSKPAIVGVEIEGGTLHAGCRLMKEDGKVCGRIRGIQAGGDSVEEATLGQQVAISIDDVMIGRHFGEGDVLYTFINEQDMERLQAQEMSDNEKDILREIKLVKKNKKKRKNEI